MSLLVTTRIVSLIASIALGASCTANRPPEAPPVLTATPLPTGSITALPTPANYMEILCGRYLNARRAGRGTLQPITADIKRTIQDLARRDSTVRAEARELLKTITLHNEIKESYPDLAQTFELSIRLQILALEAKCSN